MEKELKTYQEYNGFKVGDRAYLSDLWSQDGITFLLEEKSYKQNIDKAGSAKILAICDTGFDFRSLGFNEDDYFLAQGEWEEEVYYEF